MATLRHNHCSFCDEHLAACRFWGCPEKLHQNSTKFHNDRYTRQKIAALFNVLRQPYAVVSLCFSKCELHEVQQHTEIIFVCELVWYGMRCSKATQFGEQFYPQCCANCLNAVPRATIQLHLDTDVALWWKCGGTMLTHGNLCYWLQNAATAHKIFERLHCMHAARKVSIKSLCNTLQLFGMTAGLKTKH